MKGEALLKEYLQAKGLPHPAEPVETGPFGDSPEMARELLALIVSGRKQATCWACLNEEPPEAGCLTVVTDWEGEAGAVIETVRARKMRFSDVTWELARKEGEDETFDSWRREHVRFFTAESAAEGYLFSDDMEIIFEEFRVVWPEKYADEE